MIKLISLKDLAFPPPLPRKDIEYILFFFATSKTFKIFLEFPDVERHIKISFSCPKASSDLENILSNPKSFPQAVKIEEFCDKEIKGIAALLFSGFNLTTNSAAKWLASAADPPFPQIKILLPFFIH